MACGPITSWQIEGENVEVVRNFFLGSKTTEDIDYKLEIKSLAPWKASYDKPRQVLKSR